MPDPPYNVKMVYMTPVTFVTANGDSLILLNDDGSQVYCVPNGRGAWMPTGTSTPPVDPDPDPDPPSGEWVHPLPGATLTSPFGPRGFDGFHYGTDWSTGTGTVGDPCLAVTDLKITHIIREGDGEEWMVGNCVKANTLDGAYSFSYFHLSSISVSVGDTITAGQAVGVEGATGNVTGLHLHLECYAGAYPNPWQSTHTPIDPVPVLQENGVTV